MLNSRNGSCIDPVSLGFSKGQAFSVQVGVQRIDNIGGQTFVKQKSENVVAVVSGSLKSYLYFVRKTESCAEGYQSPLRCWGW